MDRMRLLTVHPLDGPVVALAVVASGPDPEHGKLESVTAVRFSGSRVEERFEAAVPTRAALAGLAGFVGGAPVVGGSLAAAAAFLAHAGVVLNSSLWDLGELAELLGFADSGPLAFTVDEAQEAYGLMLERARAEPAGRLKRLAGLMGRAQSPLAELLWAMADEAPAAGGGPVGGVDRDAVAERLERPRPIGAAKPLVPIDPDEITRLMSGDGPFARSFPRYEARIEQIAMARAVAEAFGERDGDGLTPHHLVVEGGTGIGKSVAYLLPAVLFAARNNVRVIVSTNTISLQEQLVAKDIPDLLDVLDGVQGFDRSAFRFAQMKGKANYLCLRRWEAAANSDMVAPDEARVLAKTLAWLQQTRTGDRAELRLVGRDLAAWGRLSATGFGTCAGAREGACFYRHARDVASAAHLLVVNHALLLSDMEVGGSVLPEADYLIVDEGHNLEDEATRQFGFRVAQSTVEELVERLGALLHSLDNVVRVSALEEARKDVVRQRVRDTQLRLAAARDAWAGLSAGLSGFAGGDGADDDDLRVTSAVRAQPAWSEIEIAWDGFERASDEMANDAEGLWKTLDELPDDTVPGLEGLKSGLAEWTVDQGEVRSRVAGFVAHPSEHTVYWLGRGASLSMNAAPLEVGTRLHDDLLARKRSVVLTSATMAVRGTFAHVRERLGIEDAAELCLGSPFDYEKAALLALPTDVPEPNATGYGEAVAHIIAELARAAGGRTMALFTSHAAIRAASSRLRGAKGGLRSAGIGVLAQGIDGTPQQLMARFQRQPRAVLLGTASFWEGVDITNEALKVLVLARLPFNVPTEPVFAARSEGYEQPFNQYAVPQAVLRFRQGFGRLIRSKDDHGAVVVLDSRITSKPYGASFLASVPPATTLRAPMAEVVAAVRDWLARAERA
ncbi:MAG: hypothetical protein J4N28_03580 [Chloroflexi bacterium]|nr:hypothetical protein [Chloroflexota bacterium]